MSRLRIVLALLGDVKSVRLVLTSLNSLEIVRVFLALRGGQQVVGPEEAAVRESRRDLTLQSAGVVPQRVPASVCAAHVKTHSIDAQVVASAVVPVGVDHEDALSTVRACWRGKSEKT